MSGPETLVEFVRGLNLRGLLYECGKSHGPAIEGVHVGMGQCLDGRWIRCAKDTRRDAERLLGV